jgi:hypothetical protein
MSRTGSMLIVNQRHPNDLKKAYQTQDELLKIAIANDANIAKARKDFKNEEPVFLTLRQSMSPEELLQDQSLQIQNALSNLLDIGFRDIEAKQIVSRMADDPDLVYKFNLTAKAIAEDVKKRFDIKILTPSFFLDYLTRYIDELDEANGLMPVANANIKNKFDALSRSIQDILQIIPKKTDLDRVLDNLSMLVVGANRQQRDTLLETGRSIRDLIRTLPSERDFAQLNMKTQVDKMEILQELQNVLDSLPDENNLIQLNGALLTNQLTLNQKIDVIDDTLGNISDSLIDDLRSIRVRMESPVPIRIPSREPPTIPMMRQSPMGYNVVSGESEDESGADTARSSPRTPTLSRRITPETPTGRGLKTKKIGSGISILNTPKHLEFGKFVIDKHRLDQQGILHFKHKSLGNTKFKPFPVSDDTRELINDVLATGKMNHKYFSKLPNSEQSYLYNVIQGAGLLDHFKLKLPNNKEDENQFEVLKGEYLAGNNSVKLIRELRALVVKFSNEGKITKRQMTDLLLEIV